MMKWAADIFTPNTSLVELAIRTSLTYLVLFFILRLLLKRETGTLNLTDILFIVLVANAAQNGMSGGYQSVTEEMVLIGVIVFWSYFLDWLSYHSALAARILRPPPLLLVKDGQMIRQNMRRELITTEELMSELRQQGVEQLSKVKSAQMEGNGQISIILKESAQANGDQVRQKNEKFT